MNKVFRFFLTAVLFAGMFTACNKPVNNPHDEIHELVLTADKYALDADGVDKINFTVTLDGKDVTESAQVCMPGDDGVCLTIPAFTTTEAGEYKFYASYEADGTYAPASLERAAGSAKKALKSKEITIVANKVSDPKKFDPDKAVKKNVAFFVWTSTACGPCFTYKTYMKKIREGSNDENIIEVNLYTDPVDCRPVSINSPEYLRKTINQANADGRFSLMYQPEILIELREDLTTTKLPTETQIRERINNYVINSPKTAIKVNSVRTGDTIDATVTIGAKEADDYLIGVFLTEDHVIGPQIGHGAGYDHTNVAREMGMENIMGESIGAIKAGQTIDKKFSIPIAEHYDPENLFLVIYVLYKEDGYAVIDNTRKVPANGLSAYEYVE